MANVLLLMPPDRDAPRAIAEAIALAQARGGRLVVVAALDPDTVERVSEALSEEAFVGEKVSEKLTETLHREYRARAEQCVAAIVQQARAAGVEAAGFVEDGDPSELCGRLVREHAATIAVLVPERRSWLTRLLARGAVRLPALPGCEVRVVDEEA
jgi:nucleotide-binding universal stress UspA family protein